MTLRVLVLTTETSHHAYFVRELISAGHTVSVMNEQANPLSGSTASAFERERDSYEISRWFRDAPPPLADMCTTSIVAGVNTIEGVNFIRKSKADVAITFGTGWVKTEALVSLPFERWNLHGGDPQKYRGLDSHLWALYHQDSAALVTTLHILDSDLDQGAIVAGKSIDLAQAPEMHMLRAANTELGTQLVIGSLAHLEVVGDVPRMPQAVTGRYYSALPDSLLESCSKRYAAIVHNDGNGP